MTVLIAAGLLWIRSGTNGADRPIVADPERATEALERAALEQAWSRVLESDASPDRPTAATDEAVDAAPFDSETGADAVGDRAAGPSKAFMRHAFESALGEHFPDRRLSSDEIERVTDSLMELREARQALQALPIDAEYAEQRRRLVERIGEASSGFRDVMDITPSEFTTGAGPGIDRHEANEVVPEPEWLDAGPRAERAEEGTSER